MKSKLLATGLLVATTCVTLPLMAFAAPNSGWTADSKLYEVHTTTGKSEIGHADGALGEATFNHPRSVVVLPDGKLLVSDGGNHLLRAISPTGVSLYGGLNLGYDEGNIPIGGYNDDELTKAAFDAPAGMAVDSLGNIYVADTNNNAIRKISKDGKVSTFAGNGVIGDADGAGTKASFNAPSDVAVDAKGNVYVADTLNHAIRKIDAQGNVTTLNAHSSRTFEYVPGAVEDSGEFADGALASSKFNEPSGLAIDDKGNLYVSDRGNQRIRYVDLVAGTVKTVAGGGSIAATDAYAPGEYVDGNAAEARFNAPEGLAVAPDGSVVISDSLNHAIRLLKDGKVSTVTGVATEYGATDGVAASAQFNHPTDVAVLADGSLAIADEYGNKVRVLQRYAVPADRPADKTAIAVLLNGKLVQSDVPAQLKTGAVFLPVRGVGTALGYEVGVDKTTGAAVLTKGDVVYTIAEGSATVTKSVGGKQETVALNAVTIRVKDRLFLPVRFFASENGLDIQWDQPARNVVIRNKTF